MPTYEVNTPYKGHLGQEYSHDKSTIVARKNNKSELKAQYNVNNVRGTANVHTFEQFA